jgi:Ca2+:H+ antiporter
LVVTSAWIGTATEQLAGRIGPTWGGMMNAGFGNLPELIFGLSAIRNGLGPLAKAAWTGAIISNILVVIGAAMVVVGLRFGQIRFSMERAQDAGASFDHRGRRRIVTVDLRRVSPASADAEDVHRLCGGNLYRSLRPPASPLRCRNGSDRAASKGADLAGHGRRAQPARTERCRDEHGVGDRAACHFQPAGGSFLGLRRRLGRCRQTDLGWTDLFIGVIVVALIGNVSALFSAVKVAQTNQMDLAFEIGISSAAQIALLVVPVLVIASPLLGNPVNILFSTAEVAAIFGTVLVISQISQDGQATWLSGVQMLVLYGLIGVLFYFLPSTT